MAEAALLLFGLVTGAAVTWLLVRAHERARAQTEGQAIHARTAAAEALAEELRKQLTQRHLEIEQLRADLDVEQRERTQAETRLEAMGEQKRVLDEAREHLADTFKALSADALRRNQTEFVERADAELRHRQEAIDATVQPLREALERYEEHARVLEAARQRAYGNLEQQLSALAESSTKLERETVNLVTALRGSDVRGRWGELTLRRVAELSGMAQNCDFAEQVTAEGEEGRVRPDMVVRLPAGRQIVVDAKVPLTGYLDAHAAATADERRAALERHAQQVRKHMQVLAGKSYWEQFGDALDFVVMFIPGEAFFGAAVEVDPTLIQDAMDRRVAIATPMTLIALLRAVELGWKQERLATDAKKVTDEGRELHKRVTTFLEHFAEIGTTLARASGAFNDALGSLQSRVLPSVRRLRDLVGGRAEEPSSLKSVDEQPRQLAVPEFPTQPLLGSQPPEPDR